MLITDIRIRHFGNLILNKDVENEEVKFKTNLTISLQNAAQFCYGDIPFMVRKNPEDGQWVSCV